MGVRAGFEADVQGSVPGAVAGRRESLLFSVGLPSVAVEAFAGHQAVGVDHHRADHRVGTGPVVGLARELQGTRGPMKVYAPVVIWGIQCWQYTRAESDHRVINNRKVIENLQYLQSAGSVDVTFSSVS